MADLGVLTGISRLVPKRHFVPLPSALVHQVRLRRLRIGITSTGRVRLRRINSAVSAPRHAIIGRVRVRYSGNVNYMNNPLTLNPSASFSGTAKLSTGAPLWDCVVRAYDIPTGILAGASSVDYITGAYVIKGLIPGYPYHFTVASRPNAATTTAFSLGSITP